MTIRVDQAAAPGLYEFFAGGGLAGMGLAAGGAGFRTLFANDIDTKKARAFTANHEAPFRLGDIWDLSPADLPGRADLAWASSPCQDVSLAGARGGLKAKRSGAFWGFWQLMQGLDEEGRAPPLIVIENVVGLLTSGGGADFAAVCAAMVDQGYVVGALEMDAVHWLPQSRPRLFIVAMRGIEGPCAAGPSGPFHSPRLIAAHGRLPDAVRAAWRWWRLPAPERRNLDLDALLLPDDQVAWAPDALGQRLVTMAAPLHRQRIAAALASGERRIGAAYRRVRVEDGVKVQRLELRFDGVAGCLRTPAGGSSRQYLVVCDQGRARVRYLTAREAARLMGVDDSYVLPGSESAALKLTGDAVAVPVVRGLAQGLLLPALGRAGVLAA